MAKDNAPRKDHITNVMEILIDQLEKGTAPWQKPWVPGVSTKAYNPTTDKAYQGMNQLWLAMAGRSDPRWMTYKQAEAEGAQVRRGEKGTIIQYWMFNGEVDRVGAGGEKIYGPDGKALKDLIQYERPRVVSSVVFNAEQIDGLPELERPEILPEHERHQRAETLMQAWPARISFVNGDRAFYTPQTDVIVLPERGQFNSSAELYQTAFHEMAHSTGHVTRLDRDLAHPFGSEKYAAEELVAEITSWLMGDTFQIGHEPLRHVSYVQSWIKALRDDPQALPRAAKAADQAHQFVLLVERSLSAEVTLTQTPMVLTPEQTERLAIMTPEINRGLEPSAVERSELEAELANLEAAPNLTEEQRKNIDQVRRTLISGVSLTESVRELLDEPEVIMKWADTDFKGIDPKDLSLVAPMANFFTALATADLLGLSTQASTSDPQLLISVSAAIENHFSKQSPRHAAFMEGWKNRENVAKPGDVAIENLHGLLALSEILHHIQVGLVNGSDTPIKINPLLPYVPEKPQAVTNDQKVFLDVPYSEKDQAKSLGARWDKGSKKWYCPPGLDLKDFSTWLEPRRSVSAQGPASRDELFAEFKAAALAYGVDSAHPKFALQDDGQIHRVPLIDQKNGGTGGAYVLFPGMNGGQIYNHRDKGPEPLEWWSSKVVEKLTPEQKAEADKRQAERAAAIKKAQTNKWALAASVISQGIANLEEASQDHPYLKSKGVRGDGLLLFSDQAPFEMGLDAATSEMRTWPRWQNSLIIPIKNLAGELMSAQAISPTGAKGYATNATKTGGTYIIGADIDRGVGPIGIVEGYATGASVNRIAGIPIACAFDSGNLMPVAKALREKYPDREIIIFGDNDHKNEGVIDERTGLPKRNVGKEKALEAAKEIGGHAVIPEFETGASGTDWNDLERDGGYREANNQIIRGMSMSDMKRVASEVPIVLPISQEKEIEKAASKKRPTVSKVKIKTLTKELEREELEQGLSR
jgi:antirestriction protein ArdC/phage/plasmid primase-like uncharacterized protein